MYRTLNNIMRDKLVLQRIGNRHKVLLLTRKLFTTDTSLGGIYFSNGMTIPKSTTLQGIFHSREYLANRKQNPCVCLLNWYFVLFFWHFFLLDFSFFIAVNVCLIVLIVGYFFFLEKKNNMGIWMGSERGNSVWNVKCNLKSKWIIKFWQE